MVKRKNLERYYTLTKIFYMIGFVLSILTIAFIFKDVFAGDIDARNIVFQVFFAIILAIIGFAFRNLNLVLKDILQEDTFSFQYLEKTSSLLKATIAVVILYRCIDYGGIGLERISLSPNMVLLLACFAFLLIVFKLFFVYRGMVKGK